MILALLLSGQGAQHPGMFDLTADHPEAQAIFSAATPLLGGADPRDLARAGGAALHENRAGQILCCVAALAGWAAMAGARPTRAIVAGYSIGDLAAWGIAGHLTPETVLGLAASRAEAMDAASGAGFGLAGIRGLGLAAVATMAAHHACHLAIRNGPDSCVVGGASGDLDALCAEAAHTGAQRAVVLPVHTPSHTPLLRAATERFREILARKEACRPPTRFAAPRQRPRRRGGVPTEGRDGEAGAAALADHRLGRLPGRVP